MTRLSAGERVLAALLAALAGFVDAVGFLSLGGFFVSFMSGNTTRMAVSFAEHSADVLIAAALIGSFVTGVVAGSLAGHVARARRKPIILALTAIVLAVAALLEPSGPPALAAAAFAMGAVNAVFESDGDVRFGLTYMTGALVKVGQRLALALRGGERFAWAPWLLLWVALATGAVLGALSQPVLGLASLWAAAAASAVLALFSLRLRRADV